MDGKTDLIYNYPEMFSFFRKKGPLPPFNDLRSSPIKEKYFVRTCQWRWLDKTAITVIDKEQPRIITLDPWPQLVFLEATGDKTISEFIHYLAGQYTSKIPPELDITVLSEIETLLGEKMIELKNEKTILPPGILQPLHN